MSAGRRSNICSHGDDVDTLVLKVRELLSTHIPKHERTYLAFGGGKDAVVLAHLAKPWRASISLVWNNTRMLAPHSEAYIRSFADTFDLIEIQGTNPKDVWARFGIPSAYHPFPQAYNEGETPRFFVELCCEVCRRKPFADIKGYLNGNLLLTGAVLEDFIQYPPLPDRTVLVADGETILSPLWHWTTEDVMAYAAKYNVELQEQYAWGVSDSMDCYACPATKKPRAMAFLDHKYPEVAASIREMDAGSRALAQRAADELAAAGAEHFRAHEGRDVAITPF